MAKFTVFFKDKPIHSRLFNSSPIYIGRDKTNDIVIDSLAVAPIHAAVSLQPKDNTGFIKKISNEFSLLVNGNTVDESLLKTGDKISIGKHIIVFSASEVATNTPDNHAAQQANSGYEIDPSVHGIPDANLQVMGGQHIGRIISLKKSMTQIGHPGGAIIISKRKDGYHISTLENNASLKVNDAKVGTQTIKLNSNDIVTIDSIPMQFFIDNH